MYCRKITKETNFRMAKEEFNSLINNFTTTKQNDDDMKVNIGVIVRTANTNEILVNKEKQVVLVSPIIMETHVGYFALIETVKNVLSEKFEDFKNITLDQLKKTVLMPVGTYIKDGELVVYFNLIIDDVVKSLFANNNYSYNFEKLDETLLSNLNGCDIIIKDTLTII